MIIKNNAMQQFRYDTLQNWENANPVLLRGEIGVAEVDGKQKIKIGNGTDAWNNLPFISSEGGGGDVNWNDITGKPSLFSGNYDDLTNKPITFPPSGHNHDDRYYTESEINAKLNEKQNTISDLEAIRDGALKGATALQSYTEKYTGTYSKPSGGIPKTDLANDVRTSLGKADTALQEHQDISGKANKSTTLAGYGITNAYTKTETDNLLDGKTDKFIDQKTYENDYYHNSTTNGNCTGYDREFATVVADYTTPWCVHVLVEAEENYNGTTIYTQRCDCFIGVTGATGTTWLHNFNVIENTSYRAFTHISVYRPATATKSESNPFRLMLRGGDNSSKTANPRKYRITLLEQINCTVTLNDALDNTAYQKWCYDDTTKAYFVGTTFRTTNFDCATNGLQETSDNNYYYQICHYYSYVMAGTGGINRYTILLMDKDGKYQSVVNEDNKYSVLTKTANTAQFKVNSQVYYYNSSTKIAKGDRVGADTLRTLQGPADMRYSFNVLSDATNRMTAYAKVYLVGTLDTDGYFKLDTNKWWTETEPTTDDGKIYVYIGVVYPDTNPYRVSVELEGGTNWYWFKNGQIRRYPETGKIYDGSVAGITIDDVYPVGSVYISVVNTNPSAKFGGTWQSIGNNLTVSSTDYFWGGINIYAWKRVS